MGRKLKKKLPPLNIIQDGIGKRIAKFRKVRGLTQKELAAKIGISRTTIADYENSRNRVYDEMIIRLAIVLEVTTDQLLGYENKNIKEINPSLRIMKRLQKIEQLPIAQQKAVLKTLDMALQNHK